MKTLADLEKAYIKKVLQKTASFKEAANILGIDLATLYRRRRRYGFAEMNSWNYPANNVVTPDEEIAACTR